MPHYLLSISGMSCAGCVASVEKALQAVNGVETAQVNFAEHTAAIDGEVKAAALVEAVKQAGYEAAELVDEQDDGQKQAAEFAHYRKLLRQALAAGLLGLPLMVATMADWLPSLASPGGQWVWLVIAGLSLAVMMYSGRHFFRGAIKSFRVHNANMDTLIALGTGTAWLYSLVITLFPERVPSLAQHAYFEAAVIIIGLINFGSAMEMRARGKTSEAIQRLIKLQPKTARVMRDGKEQDIPISQVGLGETLRALPGERIAVDGKIIDGHSYVDESMLTGEPMQVSKQTGDEVAAGTINVSGSFLYQSTRIGADTMLARIIDMVRQAQSTKPAIGRIVDKVAAVFVPSVLIIAVLSFLAWINFAPAAGFADDALSLAIVTTMTVLIIACPCALGLATPISIMVGVGKAAELGVLIRNGEALQQSARITTVVMDKTGTLTHGQPAVNAISCFNNTAEERLLQIAASLEQGSEHPLAAAIRTAAVERTVDTQRVEHFSAISGKGVSGEINGDIYWLGNARLMRERNIDLTVADTEVEKHHALAHTVMFLANEHQLMGIIAVSDPIREDSRKAVADMLHAGLKVVMLSGDNTQTANAVASQLGIEHVISEVLPEDKQAQIAKLQAQGDIVAMVGDGINDAPALAHADIGFAIGSGTDVAIESADITLMHGSVYGVMDAIKVSRATLRNIKQNLFGAFIYNSLGIPVAAGVLYPIWGILLNPMIAGAAMALSSVTVVLNANRLRMMRSVRQ